ncbi:hypothetical protein RRG08_026826 [Elysia crispata]|uniref:Uncharacterized protein n=1 Tax=Elysia crispata TaxID=231223 RepID=A0AAE0ZH88_9GAST|nr:hypothetical protein RRG08_026826 [Elysia crispata]
MRKLFQSLCSSSVILMSELVHRGREIVHCAMAARSKALEKITKGQQFVFLVVVNTLDVATPPPPTPLSPFSFGYTSGQSLAFLCRNKTSASLWIVLWSNTFFRFL